MDDENQLTPEKITEQLKAMGIDSSEAPEKAVESPVDIEQVDLPKTKEEPQNANESLSEVEQEAMAKGWKPEGEKSAEEFLRAEPLYDEIKKRGKELKELQSTIAEMKKYMDQQREMGRKEALEELKAQRENAIYEGNISKVDEIEGKMKEYDSELPKEDSTADQPEVVTNFVSEFQQVTESLDETFKERVRLYTLERDEQLARWGYSPEKHMAILKEELKEKFPSVFDKKEEPSNAYAAVESSSRSVTKSSGRKVTFADLNPDQKKAARHFDKHGVMSVDDYIKQLQQIGEI